MNIKDKHTNKVVSAYPLFKGKEGISIAIQIHKGEQLKEHITKTEAFLICVEGTARFENEKGEVYHLNSGDYIQIEPMVKHWVDGITSTQLILLK